MTARPCHDADAELVRRVQRGESRAFDSLFACHYPRLYGFALRMLGSRDDASDTAQQAFVRAFRAMDTLKDGKAFEGWLFKIVVNLVRDRAKRMKRKPWVSFWRQGGDRDSPGGDANTAEPSELADASLDPERLAQAHARDQALEAAISRLPQQFREILLLHHIQGMDLRAASETLGVPEGTLKSRLGRARQRLRAELQDWLED